MVYHNDNLFLTFFSILSFISNFYFQFLWRNLKECRILSCSIIQSWPSGTRTLLLVWKKMSSAQIMKGFTLLISSIANFWIRITFKHIHFFYINTFSIFNSPITYGSSQNGIFICLTMSLMATFLIGKDSCFKRAWSTVIHNKKS